MDFIKSLRARTKSMNQQAEKHERLAESWGEDSEAIREGVTFYVKYLGSILVDSPFGDEVSSEAVKTIVCMAKTNMKKLERVSVTMSLKGISMQSITEPDHKLTTSIYRISHCSADGHYNQVFSYLATNKNETIECHAFLCSKRKLAEAMALTVAKAFNMAFEIWESRTSKRKMAEALRRADRESESDRESEAGLTMLNLDEKKLDTSGHEARNEDLDGIIGFGLSSSPEKLPVNGSGMPMSASKCDLIDWSSAEADSVDGTVANDEDIGFDDDFTTLNESFAKIAETPKHPLREAKAITKKVSAVDLKRLAATAPLASRSDSPIRHEAQLFSRERHDSGSGIMFNVNLA